MIVDKTEGNFRISTDANYCSLSLVTGCAITFVMTPDTYLRLYIVIKVHFISRTWRT